MQVIILLSIVLILLLLLYRDHFTIYDTPGFYPHNPPTDSLEAELITTLRRDHNAQNDAPGDSYKYSSFARNPSIKNYDVSISGISKEDRIRTSPPVRSDTPIRHISKPWGPTFGSPNKYRTFI